MGDDPTPFRHQVIEIPPIKPVITEYQWHRLRCPTCGETTRALRGILVTDRYSAYNWYPVRWRQVCWAHLLRDFEALRGRGGASEAIGAGLLAQAHQPFLVTHDYTGSWSNGDGHHTCLPAPASALS